MSTETITADDVNGRQDVEDIDTPALVHEYEELQDIVNHHGSSIADDSADDAIHTRKLAIWHELERRTDLDYPDCHHCGGSRFGQNIGDPVVCLDCGDAQPVVIAEAVHEEWDKIWAQKEELSENE